LVKAIARGLIAISIRQIKHLTFGCRIVKPVAGEVVVIPFPRPDPAGGKRRPALVIADLPARI
jgi:hypothetical protein